MIRIERDHRERTEIPENPEVNALYSVYLGNRLTGRYVLCRQGNLLVPISAALKDNNPPNTYTLQNRNIFRNTNPAAEGLASYVRPFVIGRFIPDFSDFITGMKCREEYPADNGDRSKNRIYDVTLAPEAVNGLYQVVIQHESQMYLLTEQQIREGKYSPSGLTNLDIDQIAVHPDCLKLIRPPMHSTTAPMKSTLPETLRHKIIDFAEGRGAGPVHRLRTYNLDALRQFIDDGSVDELEKAIAANRSLQVIGAICKSFFEAYMVKAAATPNNTPGKITGQFSAVLGLIMTNALGKVLSNQGKDSVDYLMGKITNEIAADYETDVQAGSQDLNAWAALVTKSLSEAEAVLPGAVKAYPTSGAVIATLLATGHTELAGIFLASMLSGQLTVSELLRTKKSRLLTVLSHNVSYITSEAIRAIPAALGLFNVPSLIITAGALGVADYTEQLDGIAEIQGGKRGLQALNFILSALGQSIHTPEQRRMHCQHIHGQSVINGMRVTRSGTVGEFFPVLDSYADAHGIDRDSQYALFINYNAGHTEKPVLKNASFALTNGINILEADDGLERSIALAALADRYEHFTGEAYVRSHDMDLDIHDPDQMRVSYANCIYQKTFSPQFAIKNNRDLRLYLSNSGLFTQDEVDAYFRGYQGDAYFQQRMRLVAAGSYTAAGIAKILVIDNFRNLVTGRGSWEKTIDYLDRLSKGFFSTGIMRKDEVFILAGLDKDTLYSKMAQVRADREKDRPQIATLRLVDGDIVEGGEQGV